MLRTRLSIGIYVLCIAVLFSAFAATTAFAGPFDKLKSVIPGGGAGAAVSRADIDSLYRIVSEAEVLLQRSVNAAFGMVATKEKIEEFQMRQKKIEVIQEPKEKEAETKKFYEDKTAVMQKECESDQTAQSVASLSADQKKLLGNAAYNVVLAGLMDTATVDASMKISNGLKSNPTAATSFSGDVPKVTTIASTIPVQSKNTVYLGSSLLKMVRKAGIEVSVPQSTVEKPKEIQNF